MSLTLEELPQLQEQINQTLKELLALEDEMLPAVQHKIQEIANLLTVGFNETTLKAQAIKALNQALSTSQIATIARDATTYQNTLTESIQKLQNTILTAKQEAARYQDITRTHKGFYVGIITGSLFFVLGAVLMWGVQYNRLDRYELALYKADKFASYVNHSCDFKKDYAKFVGEDPKSFSCDDTWKSASDWYAKSN